MPRDSVAVHFLILKGVTQLNGYRILEEVGRGASGIVYKTLDSGTNRTVALKAIRQEPGQPLSLEAVAGLREAKALSHPYIAALYDVLLDKEQGREQVYAVYEYVVGPSLETMLRRLAMPEKPVLLRCFEQVADALDYADTRGIVHGDVRPSNILITTNGPALAKVTDFGISRVAAHEMTSGGGMLGTPFYLSPEEIQGTTVDGRSDQFSLAVVVYEALTGAKPFTADNLPGIFFQICKQAAKPAHQANGSLTAEVSAVLERALAKTPAQRFPSCNDFVGALEKALREIPEWAAAAEGAFAGVAAMGGAAAWANMEAAARQSSIAAQQMKRLPSLRRRGFDEDEDEPPKKTKKHSPWMLLGLMLALSAVVILLSFLWGQWDWAGIPGFKSPTSKEQGKEQAKEQAKEQVKPVIPPAATAPATQQPQSGTAAPPASVPTPPAANNPPANAAAQAENKPTTPPSAPPAAKQESRGPVPGATASIDLLSVPPGATMMIDGSSNLSCVTPCTMSLPNGRHTAAALLNGYNISRKVFNVPDDTSVVAALSASSGTLVVTSTPPGARILVDNKPSGVTPSTLHLSAGRHKLVLTLGAMQHEETIEIEGGELQSRSLRW